MNVLDIMDLLTTSKSMMTNSTCSKATGSLVQLSDFRDRWTYRRHARASKTNDDLNQIAMGRRTSHSCQNKIGWEILLSRTLKLRATRFFMASLSHRAGSCSRGRWSTLDAEVMVGSTWMYNIRDIHEVVCSGFISVNGSCWAISHQSPPF